MNIGLVDPGRSMLSAGVSWVQAEIAGRFELRVPRDA